MSGEGIGPFASGVVMDEHKSAVLHGGVWCPFCYVGRRGREAYYGHCSLHPPRRRLSLMGSSYLSRRPPASPQDGQGGEPDAGAWLQEYPALVEFLVATRWSDGDPRIPGTCTLFTEGLLWKLCLSDKAQNTLAFVSGTSPQLALLAAEKGLREGGLDWRPARRTGGPRR